MRLSVGVATMAILMCAGQAWAQSPGATAGAETPAALVSDPELASFADATIKLHALAQPTPEAMADVITAAGLSAERYNEIAAQMQKDPAFQARVNAALVKAQQAAQPQAGAAAPAAAAAAPPPPPPPLPTSGVGASVLTLLDKVCVPMVKDHEPVSAAGPRAGLTLNKREGTYTGVLGEKPYSVTVLPRGINQSVCNVEIRYPLDGGEAIANALNVWSLHQPGMKMVRNDAAVGADGLKRTTLSWEKSGDGGSAGLVFVRVQRPDGTPVEKDVGSATLLYSAS